MAGSQARLSGMITNLPDEVMETILMKLPTRDVVRTSILSSKWRYRWTEVPQFLFDESLSGSVAIKHSAKVTFITILYQFMSTHKGPVLKFVLSVFKLDNYPEIDNLIMFLSRNSIEELTLRMWNYLLPSSIFTCQELKHLNLMGCHINTYPLVFKGFSKLNSLKLTTCSICAEALRILLSGSPLLELLDIFLDSSVDLLYVDAPNLRTFYFRGFSQSIVIKRAPLLANVSIMLSGKFSPAVECKFSKLFQGLLSVESLCLNDHIVQRLAVIDHKDPTTLVNLKHVSLDPISFNDVLVLQFTFRLLRSPPNLKSIQIQFDDELSSHLTATPIYLEGEDYSDVWPSELKEVKLINISGTKPELGFIKLLLARSSTLREIHIKPRSFDDRYLILIEVIKYQRISKEAQVFFIDDRGLPSN